MLLRISFFLAGLVLAAYLMGCSAVSNLPSFQHCSEVSYQRIGAAVDLQAKCSTGYAGVAGP